MIGALTGAWTGSVFVRLTRFENTFNICPSRVVPQHKASTHAHRAYRILTGVLRVGWRLDLMLMNKLMSNGIETRAFLVP